MAVSSAAANVDQTASATFGAWEDEIAALTDASLKEKSQAQFTRVRQSYENLSQSLRQAQTNVDPTLATLKTNVTQFKYQLSVSVVAARKPDLLALEQDFADLIAALKTSLANSDAFVEGIQP